MVVTEPVEIVRTAANPVGEHSRTLVTCPDFGGYLRDGVAGPVSAALLRGRGGDLLGAPVRVPYDTALAGFYPSETRGLRYDRDVCGRPSGSRVGTGPVE